VHSLTQNKTPTNQTIYPYRQRAWQLAIWTTPSFRHLFVAASICLLPLLDLPFILQTNLHHQLGLSAVGGSSVFLFACLFLFTNLFWRQKKVPVASVSKQSSSAIGSQAIPRFAKGDCP